MATLQYGLRKVCSKGNISCFFIYVNHYSQVLSKIQLPFKVLIYIHSKITVIILNIGTDRSEQTVQTQIRLLLMEQSDQGLLCLLLSASFEHNTAL